jgi:hypothetical protein
MKQEEALLWIAEIFEEPKENVRPKLCGGDPGLTPLGVFLSLR